MRLAIAAFLPALMLAQDGKVVTREAFAPESPDFRAEEITYLSDGLRIKGYLLTPTAAGKHPCIIFNRGGNPTLDSLSRDSMIRGRMARLASAGYVIVASHYRQGGGSEGKDEYGGNDLHDVLNLIPLLEHEAVCDPTRIGMLGWSRGGMMTYRALTMTERIKAAAVGSGMADLALNLKSRPDMANVYKRLIPGYSENPEKAIEDRSAVRWASKIAKNTPLLVMQGTADWRVLPEEGLEMAHALFQSKHPFRFIMFEGGQHDLSEHAAEVNRILLNWFNDYLRDGKKWPSLDPHGQ